MKGSGSLRKRSQALISFRLPLPCVCLQTKPRGMKRPVLGVPNLSFVQPTPGLGKGRLVLHLDEGAKHHFLFNSLFSTAAGEAKPATFKPRGPRPAASDSLYAHFELECIGNGELDSHRHAVRREGRGRMSVDSISTAVARGFACVSWARTQRRHSWAHRSEPQTREAAM